MKASVIILIIIVVIFLLFIAFSIIYNKFQDYIIRTNEFLKKNNMEEIKW